MRKQFVNTIKEIIKKNKNLFIILCDIGVFGFKEIFQKFNKQIINIGILEQSTISFSAGLSKCGFIPVVHTIAPFLVERALEQIKIDYGYQKLRGNLVSVGGSYDYSSLGCTHHCPGDINILKSIPEIEIIVPGCSREFDKLFKLLYSNKKLTYFRLSETENSIENEVEPYKLKILKKGNKGTIIAIGPVLNLLKKEVNSFDLNILYCTTIKPFDFKTFNKIIKKNEKILIIEPFYKGSVHDAVQQNGKKFLSIKSISIPNKFIYDYGKKKDIDKKIGFSKNKIYKQINRYFNA
jgi:transketolase